MHIDVTEPGAFERLLTIRLDESELESAKDKAARKLAGQLKIKGFRPGKAPRSVVERMVGADTLRSEAVDEALPELVGRALDEGEFDPVTTPSVEDVRHHDDGGVEVDVRITLWPTVDAVPDYARTIEVEVPEVDDEELSAQIDRVRSQYAELEDVTRDADEGDFVTINLSATDGSGNDIPEVSATDLLYEIGSMSYIPGLDPLLVGAGAGRITDGPAILPEGFGDRAGEEVTLRVLVKGVKTRKLPELTDEWVSDVSEFDTVAELESRLSQSLLGMKLEATRGMFRDRLLDELIDDLGLDLPEALVRAEMESSLHNLAHSLESRGLDLATYLSVTGQDQEAFAADLRHGAERSIQTRVFLEGVAAIEGLTVDEGDVEAVLAEMASSSGRDIDEMREALETSGQGRVVSGDILRRKALDRVLEASTAVDANGNRVELTIEIDEGDEVEGAEIDGEGDEVDESDGVAEIHEEGEHEVGGADADDGAATDAASVGEDSADPEADEDS